MDAVAQEAKKILWEARDLISDPARWTTGTFARSAQGRSLSPEDDSAVCWCAGGALLKCGSSFDVDSDVTKLVWALIRRSIDMVAGDATAPIAAVNDNLGHSTVMRVFDMAIKMAEGSSDGN